MVKSKFRTIAENPGSTVVSEYVPTRKSATQYQSELELEQELINQLKINGFEYIDITNSEDLLLNLRTQLSKFNHIEFSETEWEQLLNNYLNKMSDDIEDKTEKVQIDDTYPLKRDDGTTKNVLILDKDNIHNNIIQVINQYTTKGSHKNRYDVSTLR